MSTRLTVSQLKKSITRRGKVKAAFYFSPSLTVTAMSVLILCLPSNVNRQVTSLVFQASKNMKRIWKCLEHTTEPVFMRQLRPIRSSDNPMATAAQAQKKPKRSSLRGLMSYTEMMMRRKMVFSSVPLSGWILTSLGTGMPGRRWLGEQTWPHTLTVSNEWIVVRGVKRKTYPNYCPTRNRCSF